MSNQIKQPPPPSEDAKDALINGLQRDKANLTKQLEQAYARIAQLSDPVPEKLFPKIPDPVFVREDEDSLPKGGSKKVQDAAAALTDAAKGRLEAAHHKNEVLPALGQINGAYTKVTETQKKLAELESGLPDEKADLGSDAGVTYIAKQKKDTPAATVSEAPAEVLEIVQRQRDPKMAILQKLQLEQEREEAVNIIPLSAVQGVVDIYQERHLRRNAIHATHEKLSNQLREAEEETTKVKEELESLLRQANEDNGKAKENAAALRATQADEITEQEREFQEVDVAAHKRDMDTLHKQFDIFLRAWEKIMEVETNIRNRTIRNGEQRKTRQQALSQDCIEAHAVHAQTERQCEVLQKLLNIHLAITTRVKSRFEEVIRAYSNKLSSLEEELEARFTDLVSGLKSTLFGLIECFEQNHITVYRMETAVQKRKNLELPYAKEEEEMKAHKKELNDNAQSIKKLLAAFTAIDVDITLLLKGKKIPVPTNMTALPGSKIALDPATRMTYIYFPVAGSPGAAVGAGAEEQGGQVAGSSSAAADEQSGEAAGSSGAAEQGGQEC